MKKFTIILVAALMTVSSFSFAGGKKDGDKFAGTIKFKITTEGREVTPTEQAQLPSESVWYYRDNMMRNDNVMPMVSVFTIVNLDSKETILLLDQMGQKYKMNISGDDIKKLEEKNKDTTEAKPEYKLLDGTKTIAGYTCKKAEIISGDQKVEIYYTNDIKAEQKDFKDAPGYVMSYSVDIPNDELSLIYQVSEVLTKKPKKSLFVASSDFEEMPDAYKTQVKASMGL